MGAFRTVLKSIGVYEWTLERFIQQYFLPFHLPLNQRRLFVTSEDPVRYGTLFLALQRMEKSSIRGSMAEVGVYRGTTSNILHKLAPERTLYLFDTFEGFPDTDLEQQGDSRFRDTSIDLVRKTIGDTRNVIFRPGYFPATAEGLEREEFALLMLDVDLYKPTLAALEFFYPRMKKGGYIFVHDYNSPESQEGVRRAVDEFMAGKPEMLIDIPDVNGSVVIRKG